MGEEEVSRAAPLAIVEVLDRDGQVRLALYENTHGFQAGTRSQVGARGGWRFAERFLTHLSVEWLRDGPETWGGEIQQDGIPIPVLCTEMRWPA